YFEAKRFHESAAIFESLYDHLLLFQARTGKRAHKGSPLVMLSECHAAMGNPVIARRNLMLATCEDSIHHKGNTDTAVDGGVYFRAVWNYGFSHPVFERYFSMIWELHHKHPDESLFPEWIVQRIDQDWMTSYPSPQETSNYRASQKYVEHLMGKLGA